MSEPQALEYAAALVAARAELANPKKDSKADTGKFSYTYLSLPALIEYVSPILARHKLAFTQHITGGGLMQVHTALHHANGFSETFPGATGPIPNDWQQIGSAISYARRYSLQTALGIAAEDDDAAATKTSAPAKVRAEKNRGETTPALDDANRGTATGADWGTSGAASVEAAAASEVCPTCGEKAWTTEHVNAIRKSEGFVRCARKSCGALYRRKEPA